MVGKQQRAEAARQQAAEVEHADARERELPAVLQVVVPGHPGHVRASALPQP